MLGSRKFTPYRKLGYRAKILKDDAMRVQAFGGEEALRRRHKKVVIDGTGGREFYADDIFRIHFESIHHNIYDYTLSNYYSYYKFPIKAVFSRPEGEDFVCVAIPFYLKGWDGIEYIKGYRSFRIQKSFIKYDSEQEDDLDLKKNGVFIIRLPNVFVLPIWASNFIVGKITPLQIRGNIIKREEALNYKKRKGWKKSRIAELRDEIRKAKRRGDEDSAILLANELNKEYEKFREYFKKRSLG